MTIRAHWPCAARATHAHSRYLPSPVDDYIIFAFRATPERVELLSYDADVGFLPDAFARKTKIAARARRVNIERFFYSMTLVQKNGMPLQADDADTTCAGRRA